MLGSTGGWRVYGLTCSVVKSLIEIRFVAEWPLYCPETVEEPGTTAVPPTMVSIIGQSRLLCEARVVLPAQMVLACMRTRVKEVTPALLAVVMVAAEKW